MKEELIKLMQEAFEVVRRSALASGRENILQSDLEAGENFLIQKWVGKPPS